MTVAQTNAVEAYLQAEQTADCYLVEGKPLEQLSQGERDLLNKALGIIKMPFEKFEHIHRNYNHPQSHN